MTVQGSNLEPPGWLLSRRSDFWLATGGASVGLLAWILLIIFRGDRELDALDLVLSEFHLGATYTIIIQRRLWRHRRSDVLFVPFLILVLTYALSMSGQTIWLTSIAMVAAVWHRGRQSLGVARFYQRRMGGSVCQLHDRLFRGAIYLPMVAGMLAYAHLAPEKYEGEPYWALSVSREMTWFVALATVAWVIAYLAWSRPRAEPITTTRCGAGKGIHPGERWVVLAHAVAFGSGYLLGASNAAFLLVLAVHHEVQYLYFTYVMARHYVRPASLATGKNCDHDLHMNVSNQAGRRLRTMAAEAGSFFIWPVVGFAGAIAGGWVQWEYLAPLGMGGLFCHYWFDSRIWMTRSVKQA